MLTGKITLPVPDEIADNLRAVRRGEIPIEIVIHHAESLEAQLKRLLDASPLPETPDTEMVERWLIHAHRAMWRGDDR